MDMDYHIALQYFAWIVLPIFLVLFATGFVHIIEPQAIGSSLTFFRFPHYNFFVQFLECNLLYGRFGYP